jgi:hypothetical protein
MLLQIILIVLFGLPERPCRHYLRHDRSGPKTGSIHVSDGVVRNTFLLLADIEDGRTNAAPRLIALAIQRRRIMNLD